MSKNKKILWILGPEEYKYASTMKYSSEYIGGLQKENINIQILSTKKKPKSIGRYLWQFVYLPIKILFFYRNDVVILPDEGYLVYTHIPFFPSYACSCIVHDYRDPSQTDTHPSLLKKLYYCLTKKGFENLKKLQGIVSVSDSTTDTLVDQLNMPRYRITTIYNGFTSVFSNTAIDTDIQRECLKRNGIRVPKDNTILLYVGSEEERKNFITLLKSIHGIPNITLIKVGRAVVDSNRKKHLSYIQEHGIDVQFVEFISDEDLAIMYSLSDIFVFPSLFEGFGRPPIEAQLSGCPVISTHSGGLKKVLDNSCLLLTNPLDDVELKGHILYLRNNPETRQKYINLGKENAQRFSLDAGIIAWNVFLQDLLGK